MPLAKVKTEIAGLYHTMEGCPAGFGLSGFLRRCGSRSGVIAFFCAALNLSAAPAEKMSKPSVVNSSAAAVEPSQSPVSKAITRAAELHRLLPAELAQQRPVHLTGVITYRDPTSAEIYLQDASDGIELRDLSKAAELKWGDRVEIEGATEPGDYGPRVRLYRLNRLASGTLPTPMPVSDEQLRGGQFEDRWIEMTGTVWSWKYEGSQTHIRAFSTLTNEFRIDVPRLVENAQLERLLGVPLRLRGVATSLLATNRIAPRTRLLMAEWREPWIRPLEPVPDNPFYLPAVPINQVVKFTYRNRSLRRIKVSGVVTTIRPWGHVAVQDDSGALFAGTRLTNQLKFGDRIEVVGFPALHETSPALDSAVFRVLATNQPVSSLRLEPEQVMRGAYDGRLVTLQGYLLKKQQESDRIDLVLKQRQDLFNALVESPTASQSLQRLKIGSYLEITGVCNVQPDGDGGVQSFRVLCWSPSQVRLLRGPGLSVYVFWGLLAAAAVALLSVGWVITLRGQVKRQMVVIEQKRKHEQMLENRYRDLFEQATDVIFELDANGYLTAVNEAAIRLSGYPRAQLIGTHLRQLLAPEELEPAQERLRQLLAGDAAFPHEWTVVNRDNHQRVLEVKGHRMVEAGKPAGVHCIGRDVTERRQLETQLRQAQKMETIGQLAAGIAHDYNNLLTVVLGHATLLRTEASLDSNTQESAAEISEAAQKAVNLTRQLLAFSRRQVMQPKVVNLNEVLQQMAKMLARLIGEHITLRFEYASNLPCVQADVSMLEQVILNLALNARDAIDSQGQITFTTVRQMVDDSYCRQNPESQPGLHVVLQVTDTGCGMDSETMAHIFEPFYTTKEPGRGTGLGLATVFGVVKQHHGWVEVESTPGLGACFRAYLPATDLPPSEPASEALPSATKSSPATILLVEDDVALRRWEVKVLKKAGFQVIEAGSGPEAMACWPAHRDQVGAVVTDMIMPGGINGRQLARHLQGECPHLRVIYTSGYSQDLLDREFTSTEAPRILRKPFSETELLQALHPD
jgi:PAS domain S-box-containing protein